MTIRAPIDEKSFQTYRARAALLGCTLAKIETDSGDEAFIIARDALCRQLDTPADVDAWLKLAGGPAA